MHVMDKRNKYPMLMERSLNAKANRSKHLKTPSARERKIKKRRPKFKMDKQKVIKIKFQSRSRSDNILEIS